MEYWDIYDTDKKKTGRRMQRNDWHMQPGDYHLTVLGVLMRKSDGRYLITQRAMTKSWAPGWWEVSGGGVMAGEESSEAVRREILEETGIDVKDWEGGYEFSYRRDNPKEGDNYFVDIYRFIGEFQESDVVLQTSEAQSFRLATADEIEALAAKGCFLHYDSIKEVFSK